MINIFRRIRRALLASNKIRKYLFYALGEIILVMIGILLALQVNNWNEQRKDKITERKLLSALQKDLKINIERLKADILFENRTINQADAIVEHLDARRPYSEELDVVFSQAIYSPDITLATSSYESIKFKGFDIVRDDSLRVRIINLFDVIYNQLVAETVRLENQFWPSSVLPLIHKHFRQQQMGSLTPTNYEALLDDTSYKNMIMHRKHFRKQAVDLKIKALETTQKLVNEIKVEQGKD